ncbi:MAG TPA: Fe-S cluster assembly protein SufD [Acidimicrobiales bacterium]|nr:Fe-S cluster assembly protein SufD [Acidimicrobiales bacterium]
MQIPTEADEDWRYGRINELELGRFKPTVVRGGEFPSDLGPDALLSGLDSPAMVVRTLDGVVVSSRMEEREGRNGIRCLPLSDLEGPPVRFGSILEPAGDAFSLLAESFFQDAVVVEVAPGWRVDAPIVVIHEITEGDSRRAVFPRTFISLAEGARATVVEHLVSTGGSPLVCPIVELDVGRGAQLAYLSVQELDRSAWQLGYLVSAVQRDAELLSFTAALGGDYARLNTSSTLDGENSSSELLAAYLADGHQVQDMRTFQQHAAPRTRSNLIFKGAVDDDARSVYSGLIHIHKGARKSDAAQTNRNLVLSENAHADSVPNLDIEENDVRCSHASAVGPIDREQRYYVESRGVPPPVAERLILLGFFEDLLLRAPEPGVAKYLRGVVAQRLEATKTAASFGTSR